LESNKLLVLPLVDSHISKKIWKELFNSATFKLMVTVMKKVTVAKKEQMNIQDWVDQGGIFKESSDFLQSGKPHLSHLKCLKGLALQVQRSDVRRKIKNFSWSELSGQILVDAWSSTMDWLPLAEMSLGYWYSTIQV
jgi:hypothetical protein